MKHLFRIALGFLLFPAAQAMAGNLEKQSNAVVRLHVTHQSWDLLRPWTKGNTFQSTCSGFFVEQGLLTNAHCIAEATFIEVQYPSVARKFEAEVVYVNHQVDLALLKVADAAAPEVRPIRIGERPKHRHKVVTIGYPKGGQQISYTEGIVSRIDVMSYAHSNLPNLLVQTDAAINPGNSGGPVFSDSGGYCVGVATQKNNSGEGLGYFVPADVIQHFLKDIADGTVDGVVNLGVSLQTLESESLRNKLRMTSTQSGVRVRDIAYGTSAYSYLATDDVIVAIDNIPIQNDAQIELPELGTVGLGYLIYLRQVGENLPMRVIRAGKEIEISIPLRPYQYGLIPLEPAYDTQPRYILTAGLLLQPVTQRFTWRFGGRSGRNMPVELEAYRSVPIGQEGLREIVVIGQVFEDTLTKGYPGIENKRIRTINDVPISDLNSAAEALARTADKNGEPGNTIVFELDGNLLLVLDTKLATERDAAIRKRYNLPGEDNLHSRE